MCISVAAADAEQVFAMMCETACQTMMGYDKIETWHREHPEAADTNIEIVETEQPSSPMSPAAEAIDPAKLDPAKLIRCRCASWISRA